MKTPDLFDLEPIAERINGLLGDSKPVLKPSYVMEQALRYDPAGRAGYPQAPGYSEPTTSKDAAKAVGIRASKLRDQALSWLRKVPSTADELADIHGVTIMAMRPRVTELFKMGLIEKTGQRRKNVSGQTAHVWRVKS